MRACTYKVHHPLSVGRCGMLQSTPLRGPMSSLAHSHHTTEWGFDTKLSHPGISFAVARYYPLWVPLSTLTVLFPGTHEQLPNGSPILELL
ncbi:unnamed protein product [Prunus brigantina]